LRARLLRPCVFCQATISWAKRPSRAGVTNQELQKRQAVASSSALGTVLGPSP
jgi:hypothetical protein